MKINKTVLLSPALEVCIGEEFVEDFLHGRKNHFCFESRKDVKYHMRDLSVPHAKRKNPVPKFFLEAIYRQQKESYPPDHFRTMLNVLLEERGKNPALFGCPQDIDPNTERLIWPEQDLVCSHDKGREFFRESKATTFHSIPDCGHVFHSDGSFILHGKAITSMVAEFLKRPGEACTKLEGVKPACAL